MTMSFDNIPAEILTQIFSYVPTYQSLGCALACKFWNDVHTKTFDPSFGNNRAFAWAIMNKKYEAVKKLLDHEKVDPDEELYVYALTHSEDIILQLLTDHEKTKKKYISASLFAKGICARIVHIDNGGIAHVGYKVPLIQIVQPLWRQCSAITKRGTQCKRMGSSALCYQHNK